MSTTDHHPENDQNHEPTMGDDPGEQGDFASGQDDEGQGAEQAVDHDSDLEEKTDSEVDPSTEREHPTRQDDDAHANEPRTDEAAPPAQGPAA